MKKSVLNFTYVLMLNKQKIYLRKISQISQVAFVFQIYCSQNLGSCTWSENIFLMDNRHLIEVSFCQPSLSLPAASAQTNEVFNKFNCFSFIVLLSLIYNLYTKQPYAYDISEAIKAWTSNFVGWKVYVWRCV